MKHELITQRYWSRVQAAAISRGFTFNITIEDAWILYENQNRRCNLTGWPIGFEYEACAGKYKKRQLCTASLDRIDPKGDYNLSNCQWLHKEVNMLKNVWQNRRFIEVCEAVSRKSYQDLTLDLATNTMTYEAGANTNQWERSEHGPDLSQYSWVQQVCGSQEGNHHFC